MKCNHFYDNYPIIEVYILSLINLVLGIYHEGLGLDVRFTDLTCRVCFRLIWKLCYHHEIYVVKLNILIIYRIVHLIVFVELLFICFLIN